MGQPFKNFLAASMIIVAFVSIVICQNVSQGFSKGKEKLFIPEKPLKISGKAFFTEEGDLFVFKREKIEKITTKGSVIWQKEIKGYPIGATPFAVIYFDGRKLDILDKDKNCILTEENLLEDIRLLDWNKDCLLIAGKKENLEGLVAIDTTGNIVLRTLFENPILSAGIGPRNEILVNLEQDGGKLTIVNSSGTCIFEKSFPDDIFLKAKIIQDKILVIMSKRIMALDLKGDILWEKPFDFGIEKAHISDEGIVAVATKKARNFDKAHPYIKAFDIAGKETFSSYLDFVPNSIKVHDAKVYISDSQGLKVFGDRTNPLIILYKGVGKIQEIRPPFILFTQGENSILLRE